jgi:hypothetical protein
MTTEQKILAALDRIQKSWDQLNAEADEFAADAVYKSQAERQKFVEVATLKGSWLFALSGLIGSWINNEDETPWREKITKLKPHIERVADYDPADWWKQ